MNKRVWIVFTVVVIAVIVGLVIWKRGTEETVDVNVGQLDPWQVVSADKLADGEIADHTEGPAAATVKVIEYGDFACSHCAQLFPTTKKIQTDYRDRVLFVYRNFSLGYPNSTITQTAAEAAGLQGKYWQMHDQLFADPNQWTGQVVTNRKELLEGYARAVGLDLDKFRADLEKPPTAIKNKLARDKKLGADERVGVSGTPTFFVNGKKVQLDSDGTALRKAIDEALENSKK